MESSDILLSIRVACAQFRSWAGCDSKQVHVPIETGRRDRFSKINRSFSCDSPYHFIRALLNSKKFTVIAYTTQSLLSQASQGLFPNELCDFI